MENSGNETINSDNAVLTGVSGSTDRHSLTDRSISFSCSNHNVQIPETVINTVSEFSIAFWIYKSGSLTASNYILSGYESSANDFIITTK